jgi:hypothetical protein
MSIVQIFPSSQFGGGPATQVPPEQVSLVVHLFWSSHDAVLLVYTQPAVGLQLSSVHTLPSLQFRCGPPTHAPPAQVSPVVQAFWSLHDAVLLVCTQPLAELQLSSVHTLPSSQFRGAPPTHAPEAHVSCVVHAFWSSQVVPSCLFGLLHTPVPGLQVPGSWHWSLAVQSGSPDPPAGLL